jgi:methionine synthase I (cobalamin-dependent)
LREALERGSLLLDAAMGTALMAQGLDPARESAPSWNLRRPEVVRSIHLSHVAAGAEVVLTNTFAGASAEEAAAAVRLARESGARFVAGSLWAGLPDLPRQIAQLEAADAIWLESAVSADQARAAVRAAVGCTSLPVVITCAMRSAPLPELRALGAAAAGYNCAPWPLDASDAGVLKPDAGGLSPERWAQALPRARLVGGCCGTTAEHLKVLQRLRATAR